MPPYACLIIPLCIILLCFCWYALVYHRAAEGYEDQNGFHYTESASKTNHQDRP